MSALGTELLWRYPSGRTVDYTRNAAGQVVDVTSKKDSGSGAFILASSIGYRPFGEIQSLTFGNGLELSQDFTQDYLIFSVFNST